MHADVNRRALGRILGRRAPGTPSPRRRDRRAVLERTEKAEGHTGGVLRLPGGLRLYTIEPPWRNNERNVSCIPPGRYLCRLRQSPRFGRRYWLQGTEPRSFILAHSGNTAKHTRGCILPGTRRGWLGGRRAVLNSRRAVRLLEAGMGFEPFWLEIEE